MGRVQIAILDALSRSGGLTPRAEVLRAAFPGPARSASGSDGRRGKAERARADAAISRAILSLERKGLVIRERNPVTGRTVLRGTGQPELPVWELLARAEEDLAAHCRRTAAEWRQLGDRARQRADTIRRERSPSSTEGPRIQDLEVIHRLEGRR